MLIDDGLMIIKGACHCGNIDYELGWPADAPTIPVRACDCGFCRKHGAEWTSDRGATLRVGARDAATVTQYRFGTKTADFHLCSRCGVVPFVSCNLDGRTYAVVNVNTFDDPASLSMSRSSTSFGAEETADRLERRRRNWIPAVEVTYLGK